MSCKKVNEDLNGSSACIKVLTAQLAALFWDATKVQLKGSGSETTQPQHWSGYKTNCCHCPCKQRRKYAVV